MSKRWAMWTSSIGYNTYRNLCFGEIFKETKVFYYLTRSGREQGYSGRIEKGKVLLVTEDQDMVVAMHKRAERYIDKLEDVFADARLRYKVRMKGITGELNRRAGEQQS